MTIIYDYRECACGCGESVKKGNQYINHHGFKGKHHTVDAKNRIGLGHKGKPKKKHTDEWKKEQSGRSLKLWKDSEYRKKAVAPRIGKKRSSDTRKKISDALKGKPKSPEQIRKTVETRKRNGSYKHSEQSKRKVKESLLKTFNGKDPLSPEARHKVTEARKRWWLEHFVDIMGESNPNWHGGKSFEPYPPEFNERRKEVIKERDGGRCFFCFSNENLLVHHIDYNKNNNEPPNLITLCNHCHGKANYNRDFWERRFKEMLWFGIR